MGNVLDRREGAVGQPDKVGNKKSIISLRNASASMQTELTTAEGVHEVGKGSGCARNTMPEGLIPVAVDFPSNHKYGQ